MNSQPDMNPSVVKTPRSFWPHAIIAWFVVFASALAAWIVFAVHQKMDLVRPDYYEQEIHYQQQLERLNRTAAVWGHVTLDYDAARNEVMLRLSEMGGTNPPTGSIHFYRPSNAELDFEVPLNLDNQGRQRIDVGARRAGLWKIRAEWSIEGQDFYFERTAVFDEAQADATPSGGRGK